MKKFEIRQQDIYIPENRDVNWGEEVTDAFGVISNAINDSPTTESVEALTETVEQASEAAQNAQELAEQASSEVVVVQNQINASKLIKTIIKTLDSSDISTKSFNVALYPGDSLYQLISMKITAGPTITNGVDVTVDTTSSPTSIGVSFSGSWLEGVWEAGDQIAFEYTPLA